MGRDSRNKKRVWMHTKKDVVTTRQCPACQVTLTGFTSVSLAADDRQPQPEPGALTVCVYCRTALVFTEDGLRVATDEEFQALDPALRDPVTAFMGEAALEETVLRSVARMAYELDTRRDWHTAATDPGLDPAWRQRVDKHRATPLGLESETPPPDLRSLAIAFPKHEADRRTVRALAAARGVVIPALYPDGIERPCQFCGMVLDVGGRLAELLDRTPLACPVCAEKIATHAQSAHVIDLHSPDSKPETH